MSSLSASIPSPPINGFFVGPLFVHFYGLMYVVGIAAAVALARRRWSAMGGDPGLVDDVTWWCVPSGIVGGRIYFDLTTPAQIPPHWWGPLAVWQGGLGIWGGVLVAACVGVWRVRRRGVKAAPFADALAPSLLVAQGVGRIGNYFNQELFGGPSTLPWALTISPQYRPPGYSAYSTFHPTFLYELLFDFFWAALIIWSTRRFHIKPPGGFALYVVGYSGFRIFEESLRIDYSQYFLGLRLNTFVATSVAVLGALWFAQSQRRSRS